MKYKFITKDEREAKILLNAQKYYSALDHVTYNIRRKHLKYSEYSESEYELLTKIFDEISDHLTSEGVDLNLD